MRNSIGLVEFKNISQGIACTDGMLKSAGIELLQAVSICPGKYIVILAGNLSAVTAAVEYARQTSPENIIDSYIIGNLSVEVFPAILGTTEIKSKAAIGIIETFTAVTAIQAADEAVKSAVVELIEIRLARGMGGKCIVLLTGSIADVTAAVETGSKVAESQGLLVSKALIPSPHPDLWEKII